MFDAFKIACWALIFIFRLRFPPGISIATIMYFNFHKILFSAIRAITFSFRKNRYVKNFTKLSQNKFKVPDFLPSIVYMRKRSPTSFFK